jgi:glycosyltransferase involved in cell wall biosynthesis
LLFIGARPNSGRFTETATSMRARELAGSLGVEGKHVFFHDEWVAYDERAKWLAGTTAAVVAAPRTLESELSVRARFLDYIWTSTPVISTRGGSFSEQVAQNHWGVVVEPEDVAGLATAIRCMNDAHRRATFAEALTIARPRFAWSVVLAPLLNYCEQPWLGNRGRPARTEEEPPSLKASPLRRGRRFWKRSRAASSGQEGIA